MSLRRIVVSMFCLGVCTLATPAVASALNITGTWNANYHCEVGWCAGRDFPAPGVVWEQEKGSDIVTAPCGGCISGILSGDVLTADGVEGSYSYHEVLTFAPDGKSWSGTLSDSNGTSGTDTGVKVSGPEEATVSGYVKDEHEKGVEGVKVKLEGKNDEEKEVSAEQTTTEKGVYYFEVEPGTYTVKVSGEPKKRNGGTLDVKSTAGGGKACDGTPGTASCALKHVGGGEEATADFTYTECSATGRVVNEKQATGCPIIFIPGFLGSRIFCGPLELWTAIPAPQFGVMQLRGDGVNDKYGSSLCPDGIGPRSGEEGIVTTAALKDIYGKVLEYLNRIAPEHVYALPYDWRKSPLIAREALRALVNEVLEKTGAKHVVLVAHSMGGLVMQSFIKEPADAEKVARAVSLGTPYWGAVKSHVALLTGKSGEVEIEPFSLDLFSKTLNISSTEVEWLTTFGHPEHSTIASDLQLAARTMQGLFWLYPADEYGPWLQVVAPGYPAAAEPTSNIRAWVASLGGTPQLVTNAVTGHAAISGYPTNGVDLQVVAGAGSPTESALKIEDSPTRAKQPVYVWFASGDGTVPLRSATEGASEGAPVPVGVHYICKVGHVDLPGDATVQKGIEEFILNDGAITGLDDNCPYTGEALEYYERLIPEHGTTAAGSALKESSPAPQDKVSVQRGARTMSLSEAVQEGLVSTIASGGVRWIAEGSNNPVTITVSGPQVAISVNSLKSGGKGNEAGSGPTVRYPAVKGSVTLSPTGAVTAGKRVVRPFRGHGAPRTTARVVHRGKRVTVALKARAVAGVAATYYRIGKGPVKLYRGAFKVKASQLKSVRFESVDRFGRWERPERLHL